MSQEITLEEAKAELSKIVEKLKAGNNNSLKNIIDSELPAGNHPQSESEDKHESWRPYYFLFLIILIISVSWIAALCLPVTDDLHQLKRQHFFYFIAFSVALASYLAATIREFVKSISKSSNPRPLKVNIFYIAIAEASLLIFGILLIFRVLIGSHGILFIPAPSDAFIVSYLSGILLYSIVLHLRAWSKHPPWKIPKKID